MADLALAVGGGVGVLLSAGYVYAEVGRFAVPQVPRSLFDENKALIAYIVGLFVGVPLTLAWVFFYVAVLDGALVSAIVDVVLLVTGGEIAQMLLVRSRFFSHPTGGPFYALSLRAGIGGLLIIGAISESYPGVANVTDAALLALQVVALLLIQVTAGLRGSLPVPTASSVVRQRLASFVLLLALYALTASGALYGATTGLVGAGIAIAGALFLYWDARPTVLAPPHPAPPVPAAGESPYRRLPSSKPGRPKGP